MMRPFGIKVTLDLKVTFELSMQIYLPVIDW